MANYKNTFTGFMAPIANYSKGLDLNIAFSDPSNFTIHFGATPEALAAANFSALTQAEVIISELQMRSDDGSLFWKLVTLPTSFTPGVRTKLPIDFENSVFNGVPLAKGSVVEFYLEDLFTDFSYDVSGILSNLLQNMPLSNGKLPVHFVWTVPGVGGVALLFDMNTSLKTDKVLKEFIFTELAFSDGLQIEDFRRPFNSSSLTGSVDFQDEAGEINAHLPISAYINPNGNVLGHLTNDANINDAAVEAEVVAGNWECKTLDLTIPTAEITGACADSFLIPTYTNTISGTVNLTAK